jgi:hypothetical protein
MPSAKELVLMKHNPQTVLTFLLLLGGALFCTPGCGDEGSLSASEEQKFKQAVDNGKGEFDLNKVPEEHRERVKAIMEANKGPQSAGAGAPASSGR